MTHTIIFNISGGAGKNIAATAVIESIKAKYPKSDIVITTPWIDIWVNNPNISKIVDISKDAGFFENYMYKRDVTLFFFDPYNDEDFLYRREHVIETWCKLCGVPCTTKQPKLYFTGEENISVLKKISDTAQTEIEKKKPLFFIQPSGGATNQPYPISWARDLPLKTAEEVVDKMNNLGYRTIHIRRKDQIALPNTTWIEFSIREAMCAIQFSTKRLFVDSLAAHVAGALALPAVVVWVTNSPKVFGYEIHTHIEAFEKNPEKIEFRHSPDAYLDAYNIAGIWSEHPFSDDVIFDTNDIVKKLNN